jgi:hypothetical protein
MGTHSDLENHKVIPLKYKDVILDALSYYPELSSTHIIFRLTDSGRLPYRTVPSRSSFFKPKEKRVYIVTILEEAKGVKEKVLFKNLPPDAQLGVLGHELGHIVQFNNCDKKQLLRSWLSYTNFFVKREIERNADVLAIEHGLGKQLHVYSVFIRQIKGYLEKRKEIETNYLKPHEILQGISQKEKGTGV